VARGNERLGFQALLAGLKASSEDTRLRLLALLAEAELTVSDLTDILRQSQPRISRHLKLLSDAGLIERQKLRVGSSVFWSELMTRLSERFSIPGISPTSSPTIPGLFIIYMCRR